MTHCPECAATLSGTATFCSMCGALLPTSPATIASQSTAPRLSDDARLLEDLRASLAPHYELLKPLGSGGMGAVFLAREPALKRLVAVKVLSPYLVADAIAYSRFEREARAVAALSHPNVVSIYAIGETAGLRLPYIVMQYVDGPPLSAWIQEHGRAGEREARRILGGVAAALADAHSRGLVHRDVKPGNILLEPRSNRILVVDFGLTAALSKEGSAADDASLTASGMVLGTPVYMSPEQALGERVDAKSDIYSLGMVAYELLTGQLPFSATSAMGWAAAHLRDTPRPLSQLRPDLSPEVAHLVDRCLTKAPTGRPTAQEFAEGILPSLEAEVQWPPTTLLRLFGRGRILVRSIRLTTIGLLLLLIALAAPPRRVTTEGAWWRKFEATPAVTGSSLGLRREAPESAAAGTLRWWFAALVLGASATIGGSIWFLARSYPALRCIANQNASGWRWSTLADVLADPDGRSGLILKGAREMAAIAPHQRARVLQARRRIVSAQLLGGVWVTMVSGAWAVFLLIVPGFLTATEGQSIPGPVFWTLLLIPLAIASIAALVASVEESRLFGALPRRRTYTGTLAAARSVESKDDAAAWYAQFPGPPGPRVFGPPVFPVALKTAYLLAILLGSTALTTLMMTSAAVAVAARRVLQLGPETAQAAALLEQREGQAFWGRARDAWWAYLPPPLNVSDSAARSLVWRLIQVDSSAATLPAYPISPAEVVRALGEDTLRQGVATAFQSGFRALTPDTMRLLKALSEHPRTGLLREIARAPRVDILGSALDGPVTSYGTLDSLPEPPYGLFRTAAQANLLGALLEISQGDRKAAAQRLGENVALAEHFLRAPSLFANRYGVGMLQQLALLPLVELERSQGNREQAERLATAGAQMREEVFGHAWPGRLAGLAAEPTDLSHFSAALLSERLSPGYRVDSFYGGWAGFCLNRGEILRGLSPLRKPAVLNIADAMTGVPHAGELARLTATMWAQQEIAHLEYTVGRLLWCWNVGG